MPQFRTKVKTKKSPVPVSKYGKRWQYCPHA